MYLIGQWRISIRRLHYNVQRQVSFTLIELIIVVTIIATLAAIGVPNFFQAQIRAKAASVVTNQAIIAAALDSYYVDYEQYPMNNLLEEAAVPASGAGARPGAVPPSPPDIAFFPFAEPERPPTVSTTYETTGPRTAVPIPGAPVLPMRRLPMQRYTYRAGEATTRTIVREIPYSPDIPITVYPWRVCSRCGRVNAETESKCIQCGHTLGPSERYMIYSQSLNGSVLSVLTTPIAYLPTEVNDDVFNREYGGRYVQPQAFSYIDYLQINPKGMAIPPYGPNVHYAIISHGPDLRRNYINSYPTPHVVMYDPTNGTVSAGDIINFGQ